MRGQAFDTFKLLIAAVVAIAILGVLLAILSGIIIPGAEPPTMIREQLSKATQYPDSSFISPTKASFTAGVTYKESSFTDAIGGYGSIEFICSDNLGDMCEDGDQLKITGTFDALIGACCNRDNDCIVSVLTADEEADCP